MRTDAIGVECCAMAMVALMGQVPTDAIRGRVIDDRGQPVAAAVVTLTCGQSSTHDVSDGQGEFSFAAPPPRQACELVVSASGRTVRIADVRPGSYSRVKLGELATPVEIGTAPRSSDPAVQAARIRSRMLSAEQGKPKWSIDGWSDQTLSGDGSAFGFTPRGAFQAPNMFGDRQGWSAGITARRRIPGKVDVTALFGAHRRPDALSATITDLVGSDRSQSIPVTPFFDPSRSMTYWETKLRVERGFTWRGLELRTLFEAHAELSPSRSGPSTLLPSALEQQATSALRGRSVRFGLVVAY